MVPNSGITVPEKETSPCDFSLDLSGFHTIISFPIQKPNCHIFPFPPTLPITNSTASSPSLLFSPCFRPHYLSPGPSHQLLNWSLCFQTCSLSFPLLSPPLSFFLSFFPFLKIRLEKLEEMVKPILRNYYH